MKKKPENISINEFMSSFGDAKVPIEAANNLYEFVNQSQRSANRWRNLLKSDNFEGKMSFILSYAANQSGRMQKKDRTINVLAGVIAASLGIGAVYAGAYQINEYCKEDILSDGPHGAEVENYKDNDSIVFGLSGENCNSGILLTLNKQDKYYNESVVLVTNLQSGAKKSLRVVDATKPVRVVAEPGDYQIMLVTLPNGDVCGNVYNVTVEEGCFKNLDISAKYQQTKDRVR